MTSPAPIEGGRWLRVRDLSVYAVDLETLRARVAVEGRPPYLLGHSMGGCIALDYAIDHQEEDVLGDLTAWLAARLPA